jgi:hypothetical protein
MGVKTPSIVCAPGEWTEIANGYAQISFQLRGETDIARYHMGTDEPDIDTTDYWTLRPKSPQNYLNLAEGMKIWVRPESSSYEVTIERALP